MDQCSLRMFFVRKEEENRGRREEKASDEGERVEIVVPPRSEEMFVLWTRRGLSRGAIRYSVAAVVVEIRPSARSVKVVVAEGSFFSCTHSRCLCRSFSVENLT